MASSRKKRMVVSNEETEDAENKTHDSKDDVESDNDEISEDSDDEFVGEVINVELEARLPEACDYDGIRLLLQQLFLKYNINLGDLTDLIISQNYVGSVLMQITEDEDDDDDDAMEIENDDYIYGLMTVINITDKQSRECIKQLVELVTSQSQKAAPALAGKVSEILRSPENPVGFLISERNISISAQVSLPSFQSLKKDLEKACRKKMNFAFKYFMMLCKTYRCQDTPEAITFTNEEEEVIAEVSEVQVTWSVADQRDDVAGGRWDKEGMEATRTLLLFSADKLDHIIKQLQAYLAS